MATIVGKTPDAEVAQRSRRRRFASPRRAAQPTSTAPAIVGFCWGGRQVWLYAARNPRLRAAVAWYGPLASPASDFDAEKPARRRRRI